MTESEMQEKLQSAEDMLVSMADQRNASQNSVVQMAAQVKAMQRKVADLEAKLKEASKDDEPRLPFSNVDRATNGHATEERAAAP